MKCCICKKKLKEEDATECNCCGRHFCDDPGTTCGNEVAGGKFAEFEGVYQCEECADESHYFCARCTVGDCNKILEQCGMCEDEIGGGYYCDNCMFDHQVNFEHNSVKKVKKEE